MGTYSFRVLLVQHEPHEVKAGQEGCRQVHVLHRAAPHIVPPHHWVGCCQHCGPSVQSGCDPSLRNAHCLLLHDLHMSIIAQ